jgi:hypothetical protein
MIFPIQFLCIRSINQYTREIHAYSGLLLASFIIAKLWNQPRYPTTNEWIKKKYIHVYNRELLNHKEK